MARQAKSRRRFRKPPRKLDRRNSAPVKVRNDIDPMYQEAIHASVSLLRYADTLLKYYIFNPSRIQTIIKAQSIYYTLNLSKPQTNQMLNDSQ